MTFTALYYYYYYTFGGGFTFDNNINSVILNNYNERICGVDLNECILYTLYYYNNNTYSRQNTRLSAFRQSTVYNAILYGNESLLLQLPRIITNKLFVIEHTQ